MDGLKASEDSSYDVAVNEWLAAHGIEFTIERTGEQEGFPGEAAEREKNGGKTRLMWHDVYAAKFVRARSDGYCSKHDLRPHTLDVPTFYQSAAHSASALRRRLCDRPQDRRVWCEPNDNPIQRSRGHQEWCGSHPKHARVPTAYDVLAAITKSDPGTFGDFCGEYGYDTDSRRAMDTYLSMQNEWARVRAFFTGEELEELQEIAQ